MARHPAYVVRIEAQVEVRTAGGKVVGRYTVSTEHENATPLPGLWATAIARISKLGRVMMNGVETTERVRLSKEYT